MSDLSPDTSPSQALATTIKALPRDATRPAQTRFTRAVQAQFLRRLADSGEVRVAVSGLGVSHQTVYRMRRACRAFARGWDAALLIALQKAEDILASRAMHGVEEEVYYHGEVVATRRRYDARLLLAHLARLDRKAQDTDLVGLAERFDSVVEAFEEGGAGGLAEERESAAGTEEEALDCTPVALPGAPAETTSGPCNTWSMSRDDAEGADPEATDPDPEAPESEPEPEPELERRLRAMEAARPDDAPTLKELAETGALEALGTDRDPGAIEAAQLAAFEAGEPYWWLATPQRGAGDWTPGARPQEEGGAAESRFRDSWNRGNLDRS